MKIHFIGICGVAMSALAIALREQGHTITGSDKGFYPPVSDYLRDKNISFYPGWHPEKMTENGVPDLVVVGNVAGSKNPEWLRVQEHDIPYRSYPEIVGEQFVGKTSIVAAGTYGKSTSTSLMTWILKEAGKDPSYMFGGISLNDMPSAHIGADSLSILEGDEYKSARWDDRAKFVHYSPTHLLLTSVVWDHADVYPTEKDYTNAFENLVSAVPADGLVVLSAKVIHDQPDFAKKAQATVVTYGRGDENDYQYVNVTSGKEGGSFEINHGIDTYHVETPLLGDYMADNMTGCFALMHQLGIEPAQIIASMKTFRSVKRRLERRVDGPIALFDDIAHSPKKAEAVLRTLKNAYSGRVYAIFEPNGGNRTVASVEGYHAKFRDADTVIIPRLSTIKRKPGVPAPLDGAALAEVIGETHTSVHFIDDDQLLLDTLTKETKKDDVIVFLGSHGFRGMIEELMKRII